jgi:hypothetical protein
MLSLHTSRESMAPEIERAALNFPPISYLPVTSPIAFVQVISFLEQRILQDGANAQ